MKGLVGAIVEPQTYAVVTTALADAVEEYQASHASLVKRRRRVEKSALGSPAREAAQLALKKATRRYERAELALLKLAAVEVLQPRVPEETEPPKRQFERGTPAQMRAMLAHD